MGDRRRSREIALQVLFQTEFTSALSGDQALGLYLDNFEAVGEVRDFASQLVKGVWENRTEIDSLIQAHSQSWKVTRMAFVDKNILRIAVFELKFLGDHVPFQVALDEAIEIGKRFGSLESSAFINGVLDNIAKSLHQ
jgi:transcription antitermination protein NusB